MNRLDLMQWSLRLPLRGLGFTFESRRLGERQIGLWRRKVGTRHRDRRATVAHPRRWVIIPGLGDSPFSWLGLPFALWPLVTKQFDEIVWLDFPAFAGFWRRSPGFESMDALQSAVFDVLDSLRPECVLGHSLGGWLAAAYAARCGSGDRPHSVPRQQYQGPGRLLLLDPAGLFADAEHRLDWEATFKGARELGFGAMRDKLFHREPRWFKWIESDWGAFLDREEVKLFFDSVREEHYLGALAAKIQARTWVLWGEHDALFGKRTGAVWVRTLAEGGTQVSGAAILEAGHGPQIERPMATALLVGRALTGRPLIDAQAPLALDHLWKESESAKNH